MQDASTDPCPSATPYPAVRGHFCCKNEVTEVKECEPTEEDDLVPCPNPPCRANKALTRKKVTRCLSNHPYSVDGGRYCCRAVKQDEACSDKRTLGRECCEEGGSVPCRSVACGDYEGAGVDYFQCFCAQYLNKWICYSTMLQVQYYYSSFLLADCSWPDTQIPVGHVQKYVGVLSYKRCHDFCSTRWNCFNWDYIPAKRWCFLRTRLGSLVPVSQPGYRAGPKNCP